MKQIHHDIFDKETICTYRDETYSVRDNGEVFRHSRKGARKRPLDEKWRFGRTNYKHGYMYISSTPVHRIVATAFYGPEPFENMVVDHIDNNQRNNRPENLRWLTRLENIILNPITARKVIIAYGSIENYLANPGSPKVEKLEPNFEWMRLVTPKEAEVSLKRMLDWAMSGGMPSGGKLGEWLYKPRNEQYVGEPQTENLIESKTPNATQKNWKTPTEFPLCPPKIGEMALNEYRQSLKKEEVFSRNQYGESKVVSAELSESSESLLVLCSTSGAKDWVLARVSLDDQLFVHENLGSLFTLEGATKRYTLERGLKWESGNTIDDYC